MELAKHSAALRLGSFMLSLSGYRLAARGATVGAMETSGLLTSPDAPETAGRNRSSRARRGDFDVPVEQARRGSTSASLVSSSVIAFDNEVDRRRDGRLESEALAAQDE